MEVTLEAGRYVIAVSGGVDSMVLLDILSTQKNLDLIVAHFDHGIRIDSAKDRQLVQAAAQNYGLPFAYAEGRLGNTASESLARQHRYSFLQQVQQKYAAQAIITAHHRDDLLETIIINLLRGTGRKGLSSLQTTTQYKRPLLAIPKSKLYEYAQRHSINWREDSTNQNDMYLRNYVRRHITPFLPALQQQALLDIAAQARARNSLIDALLDDYLAAQPKGRLSRADFKLLPNEVAREIMAGWLRRQGISDFNRGTIQRAVRAGQTFATGKRTDILRGRQLVVGRQELYLTNRGNKQGSNVKLALGHPER